MMQRVTTNDITSGRYKLPFTSISSWLTIQAECRDLRRTHAHLNQGTRPSRKITNAKDVKRYLNVASIARDGMLVVRRNDPLSPSRECIIVPRMVLNGLVTALHIQLEHHSAHQLKQVMRRYLFALDLDKAIKMTSHTCHHCASVINTPTMTVPQSTSDPPEVVGISYAADIIKRERQPILVLRECVTSYTACCFVADGRRDAVRDSLIDLCAGLRPLDGPPAVIRTDPAAGFATLVNDALLAKYRLTIELGRVKKRQQEPGSRESCSRARVRACTPTTYRWHRYSACAFSRYCKPQHSRTKQGVFCSRVVDTTRPVHKRAVASNRLQPHSSATQIAQCLYHGNRRVHWRWGLEGVIIFVSICSFPDESAYVCQIWCQSVLPFGRFPPFFNF